ncbi:MAG: restriction endonuclease [Conexibacter sp.]|nr:restriction endonuclease [Conexibacter sp.]
MSDPALTTVQRKGEILLALLPLLAAEADGVAAKDAIQGVERALTLTEYEEGSFDSGGRRFPRIVRFTTITAVHAGWMNKSGGIWTITDAGTAALAQHRSPEALFKAARTLYRQWKKERRPDVTDDVDDEDEVKVATTLEDAEDQARTEILDYVGKLDPFVFQEICRKLIEALGHEVVWVSPPGPDGGIDLVAYADAIGVYGRRIKGQAKRTPKSKQDSGDVQQFLSTIATDDVGVFIALGGFTRSAMALARGDQRRLILIDGPRLLRLWIEYYDKLDEEGRNLLRLKPIHYLVRD